MKAQRLFWCVIAAQAVFLLAWAGWHEQVRRVSPVIRLKTEPVDPRDLLRGDFMILNYAITRPPLPVGWKPEHGAEVWVVLALRDGYHEAVRSSATEPSNLQPGELVVRSRLRDEYSGQVDYGIETFFVPEGKGTPRFTTLEVEASVSAAHKLYIKRVWLDGRPYP